MIVQLAIFWFCGLTSLAPKLYELGLVGRNRGSPVDDTVVDAASG
jgi:hypothetical protein